MTITLQEVTTLRSRIKFNFHTLDIGSYFDMTLAIYLQKEVKNFSLFYLSTTYTTKLGHACPMTLTQQ